jgi:hypothetical protein
MGLRRCLILSRFVSVTQKGMIRGSNSLSRTTLFTHPERCSPPPTPKRAVVRAATSNLDVQGGLPDGWWIATIDQNDVWAGGLHLNQDVSVDCPVLTADAYHTIYPNANGQETLSVGLADYNDVLAHYNQSNMTYIDGDFAYQGTVGLVDYNAVFANYNAVLTAPPTSPGEMSISNDGTDPTGTLDVDWTAPASTPTGFTIVGYQVQQSSYNDGAGETFDPTPVYDSRTSDNPTALTCQIHGLDAAGRYWFRVRAVYSNANGNLSYSAYSAKRALNTLFALPTATASADGTTVSLSALEPGVAGDPGATYSWVAETYPAGAAAPAIPSSTSAQATATVYAPGTYAFQLTVDSGTGLMLYQASVPATVVQVPTAVAVSPTSATVALGQSQQFTVAATDQFGNAMDASGVTWSVTDPANGTDYGSIDSSGVYTAPSDKTGTFDVTATDGAVHATTTATVVNPLLQGLVGWWKLDDGTGSTAADSSGNGDTGTLMNGAAWAPGRVGPSSVSLDGSDQFVDVGNPSDLNLTSAMTLSAWVEPTSLTAWQRVITKMGDDSVPENDSYVLGVSGNGGVYFGLFQNGSQDFIDGSTPLTLNAWNHIVATYDGNTARIYLNGVLQQEEFQLSGAVDASTGDVRIGIGASSSYGFQGAIDDARIYDRALSQQDVENLYNSAGARLSAQAGDRRASLSWSTVAGASSYNLYRSTSAGGEGTVPYLSGLTDTTFTDTGLTAGTTYYYTVAGVINGVAGPQSNEAEVTPHSTEVLHFGFDEGSGTTTTDSIDSVVATVPTGVAWAPPRVGAASLSFDGSSGLQATDPALPEGDASRTISCWFRTSTVGEEQYLATYGGGAVDDSDATLLLLNGQICVTQYGDNISGGPDVADGAWHFAAATFDSGVWSLFLDGSLVGSKAMTTNTTDGPVLIGQGLGGDFTGQIDEVTVYDTALSADDLQTIYASAGANPVGPTDLTASVASPTEIDLTWGGVSGATGYTIEADDGAGNALQAIDNVDGTATTYQATGLDVNSSYTFCVVANFSDGSTVPSNTASASTPDPVPQNLQAQAVSTSEIDLSWSSNYNGEVGFIVEEQQSDGSWQQVGETASGTYTDAITGLNEGTSYTFEVEADYGSSQSTPSNTASATTELAAPTDASATPVHDDEANVTWNDNSSDEDGFDLTYVNESTNVSSTVSVPPNGAGGATGFALTGLTPGTDYDVNVTAFKGSATSTPASTTFDTPLAPNGPVYTWSNGQGPLYDGNNTTTLTITNLPPDQQATIVLDPTFDGTWDGTRTDTAPGDTQPDAPIGPDDWSASGPGVDLSGAYSVFSASATTLPPQRTFSFNTGDGTATYVFTSNTVTSQGWQPINDEWWYISATVSIPQTLPTVSISTTADPGLLTQPTGDSIDNAFTISRSDPDDDYSSDLSVSLNPWLGTAILGTDYSLEYQPTGYVFPAGTPTEDQTAANIPTPPDPTALSGGSVDIPADYSGVTVMGQILASTAINPTVTIFGLIQAAPAYEIGTAIAGAATATAPSESADVLIGATNPQTDSLHDDWVAAADNTTTPAHTETINDYVVFHGQPGGQLPYTIDAKTNANGGTVDFIAVGPSGPAQSSQSLSGTVTLDATGSYTLQFFIEGQHVSSQTEDVTIVAKTRQPNAHRHSIRNRFANRWLQPGPRESRYRGLRCEPSRGQPVRGRHR